MANGPCFAPTKRTSTRESVSNEVGLEAAWPRDLQFEIREVATDATSLEARFRINEISYQRGSDSFNFATEVCGVGTILRSCRALLAWTVGSSTLDAFSLALLPVAEVVVFLAVSVAVPKSKPL